MVSAPPARGKEPRAMSDSLLGPVFDAIMQKLLEELRPRMRAAMMAAFDDAWDAAMQRLVQPPAPAPAVAPTDAAPEKPSIHRTKPPSNVGSRAAWGTTKQVIQGAFASPGFKGMTPKGIAEWGSARGQKVAQSSVRT